MSIHRYLKYLIVIVACMGFAPPWVRAAENLPPVPDQDMQVLASGPVHEAFAEAVNLDPEPGIWAPQAPPAMIEEIPPAQKPEGNVQWIPGYWAWDDDLNHFIWVSGIWRVAPPGRQWIPGYWNPGPDGYQWISGYWAGANVSEAEYLPEPPESVEIGPNANAPSSNYVWIPGCWEWYYGRYAWRPGYWAKAHSDWIWVPAHYVWSPRGYIYVGGYWDFTVTRRGVLYAPVYFTPGISIGFRYWFSPNFVVDLRIFDDALFLRPRYHHYYFGDYYAPKYYKRGIYPWFSLHARRVVYDPIYSHQRWQHRDDRNWENHLQKNFRDRRDNEHLRPSRQYEARREPDHRDKAAAPQRPNFIMPVGRDQNAKAKVDGYRFQPLNEKERRDFSNQEKEVRSYRDERRQRESVKQQAPQQSPDRKFSPEKDRFPQSPIMDRGDQQVKRKKAPERYKEPNPNPNVEPLERRYDPRPGWERPQRQQEVKTQPESRENPSFKNDRGSGNGENQSQDRSPKTDDRQQKGDWGNGKHRDDR